jgi:GntR family transcriptional regulator / MocR family aminotransferase
MVRSGPGARQIYETLRDQIASGVFGVDGHLPSSRSLALELGVSRTTITVAYDQLLAEGFIDVRQGARPQVAEGSLLRSRSLRAARPRKAAQLSAYGKRLRGVPPVAARDTRKLIADFRYGDLAPSDFPRATWRRAITATMAQQLDRLAYDDPRGSERLRMALQGYLWRARRLRCDLEQIVIVNGSQQGLDLCARLLLDADDRFIVEDPGYAMARYIFASTGAVPVPTKVDGEGLVVDALGDVAARLAYVTPSHQFPLGSVMAVARRRQLLEWAQRMRAYLVEDDYDSEFRYDIDPVPPLHTLDAHGNVIYLGTVSKTLSPTLRIGYLVVPHELQASFAMAKQLSDRHSAILEQDALASVIESGLYESHIRKMRRRHRERRETLLAALRLKFGDRVSIAGADAGLHVVASFLDLPRKMEAELIDTAQRAGIGMHSVSELYATSARPAHVTLIMGYAALDPARIERGIHILADVVQQMRR